MLRTETTNEPSLIAKQPLMTSVNTALQVDLYAQANASRVKGQIFGLRRPDRLSSSALHSRRPGDPRAAVVAPEGERVHDRADDRGAGDVVPGVGDRHGERPGMDLGLRPCSQGAT